MRKKNVIKEEEEKTSYKGLVRATSSMSNVEKETVYLFS